MSFAGDYYSSSYGLAQRSGLQGWGNSLIDRLVEKYRNEHPNSRSRDVPTRVLEVESSAGKHLHFVPSTTLARTQMYVGSDLRTGVTNPRNFQIVRSLNNVVFTTADATNLPFWSHRFDTTTSTCVLARVREPEDVFLELRRLTRIGGKIVVGMPCDPGAANRLVKSAVTYRSLRAVGVHNPRLSYARGHRNGISILVEIAKHVFRHDRLRFHWFPLGIPSWNLDLVCLVDVTVQDCVTRPS